MTDSKVILITGASSGIGKATAEKLVAEGHKVYASARRVEKMQDLKEKGVEIFKLDITDYDNIKSVVDQIIKKENKIDVLFNNAGYGLYGSVEEIPIEKAKHQFEVNIFGLAKITQEIIPHMRKQGSGKIINTSSMGGKIYTPMGAWYHATKHALEGWSDCLRIELKQFGIDVVIVEPGAIKTEFANVMSDQIKEFSGSGPYKEMVEKLSKATQNAYEKNQASPPSVIADEVSKAIKSSNPKTRYVAGNLAKPMMFIRKHFGDRVFDWILRQYLK